MKNDYSSGKNNSFLESQKKITKSQKNHKNVPDIFLLMCEMDKRFEGEKIS